MKREYSFIFSSLITLLIFSNVYLIKSLNDEKGVEKVKIVRIIDGDTFEIEDGRTIRLANINSPEKGNKGFNLSVIFLKKFEGQVVEMEVIGLDKYNRVLARIYDNSYLNLEMVKRGYSSKFLVDKKELIEFSNAEEDAIKNFKGVWEKSEYFGCFIFKISSSEERILIINKCPILNLKDWQIKDESRKIYIFSNVLLGRINLNSFYGKDNSTDIFWNSKTNILNNDRDSIYLFDNKGRLAGYESYGY